MRTVRRLLCVAWLAWLACTNASAQTPPSTPQPPRDARGFTDVDELRLEDLLDLAVSIAAGRIQRVEEAPGIVSVITDEEIRRMGAQTLSDVLAIIPGFEVLTDNVGRSRIAVRGIVSHAARRRACSSSSTGVVSTITSPVGLRSPIWRFPSTT